MSSEQVIQEKLNELRRGDFKILARCISIVENELPDSRSILELMQPSATAVIGITGPPGAGKSTLLDALVAHLRSLNKTIGILAVDPSSPFHLGSLLGDRIRMSRHFNDPGIYIRSLSSRGSLGGLSARIIEISDLMRCCSFDYIFIETVGVGQSEVEIAGLSDCTLLVLVPESGDEIQQIKSGIMEIGDIFVVNKSDRPGADRFMVNLYENMRNSGSELPYERILKTIATKEEGIQELWNNILKAIPHIINQKKDLLRADRAYRIIQSQRMKGITRGELEKDMLSAEKKEGFNFYKWLSKWFIQNPY